MAAAKMWWDAFNQGQPQDIRPPLVRFVDCRDVLIDGLHFSNSPRWTLSPVACDNVTITKVTIRNPHDSPNTDGINPDSCSNVHIANCHIDVGDDCIAIKSGSEEDGRPNPRPCQNITITNCTMLHGHGGVVIGSEMTGGVRNVSISNCVFCGTDRGIRLKSRRGRGNAVEDLRVDNIVMDEVHCPIVVNLFYVCGTSAAQQIARSLPAARQCRHPPVPAAAIQQHHRPQGQICRRIHPRPPRNVRRRHRPRRHFHLHGQPKAPNAGSPAMAAGVHDMCRAGVVLKNARNVKLRRIDLYDQLGPAVTIDNSQEILISDLYANADNGPLLLVDGVDSTASDDDDAMDGGLVASSDAQRVRTFTRGWRFGRRPNRSPGEAAISKLTIESPNRR